MKERIIKFARGPRNKKYTAFIRDNKTKKERKVHFGDKNYQQYKDRTPLQLYKHKNHGTLKRQHNYYNRHSGTKSRRKAIKKERRSGRWTPKLLSHVYLW